MKQRTLPQLKTLAWEWCSRYIRTKYPYCQICLRQEGQHTHHIIKRSLSSMLYFEERNLLALCKPCHDKIHIYYKNHKMFEATEMANILLRLIGEDGINYLEYNKHKEKKYSHYELEDMIATYKLKIIGLQGDE